MTYIYIWDLPNAEWVTKVKPNINSVGVHLLLSHIGHIVAGRLFTLDQPVSAVPFENLFNSWIHSGGEGELFVCFGIT